MGFNKLYKKFSFKNIAPREAGMIVLSQEQIIQLHKTLLSIMDDILSFCKQNNIMCVLGGGTALGAIRHNGFIPWDDDVDLNMTRESYERFIPLFKEKFKNKYWIQSPEETPILGMHICRIRKKGTRLKTKEDFLLDEQAGVFVDIFVIENTPNSKILRFFHGILANGSKTCLSCRRFYRDKEKMLEVMGNNNASKVRLFIGKVCSFISVERWVQINNKINSMCKNNKSKYVSIPTGRWHYFGEMYERDWYCNTRECLFEGRTFDISADVEKYLSIIYGDNYMQIPPKGKREEHACWEFDID